MEKLCIFFIYCIMNVINPKSQISAEVYMLIEFYMFLLSPLPHDKNTSIPLFISIHINSTVTGVVVVNSKAQLDHSKSSCTHHAARVGNVQHDTHWETRFSQKASDKKKKIYCI